MDISVDLIKELRDRTGSGMMDCKKALIKAEGDIDRAVDILREKGLSQAAKKQSRVAAEGITKIINKGDVAYVFELNSETDFVAKNDRFINLQELISDVLINSNVTTTEEALALPVDGMPIEQHLTELTAVIGEKITLRKVKRFEKNPWQIFGEYSHQEGKISALVILNGADEEVAKNIALQVTASNPLYLSRSDIPEEFELHEKQVLTAQAVNEGKPEKIIPNIVNGRYNKYLSEIVLTEQVYIKDTDIKVKDYLSKNESEVVDFYRIELGEGIEKREENLADEIAKELEKYQPEEDSTDDNEEVEIIEKVEYVEVQEETPQETETVVLPVTDEEDDKLFKKRLSIKTVAELKDICRENKISGFSGLKKADLVNLIFNALR